MDKDEKRIYTEGKILELRSKSRSDTRSDKNTSSCKIIRLFNTPGFSFVVEIELWNKFGNQCAMLNMFDR
ncbi:hypothetical protein BofuT4_uP037440.1 [Botrytis cinerea T4]|uniref:Uncharacterized protein n=1 Tax=Botryotinia fuckeliana (strain T4) TaxID=999810 RepID=G2Y524_BOTF4|nr:hypothetical protein BofuT4_uP037440.1 [Botrytis cinerea T4]